MCTRQCRDHIDRDLGSNDGGFGFCCCRRDRFPDRDQSLHPRVEVAVDAGKVEDEFTDGDTMGIQGELSDSIIDASATHRCQILVEFAGESKKAQLGRADNALYGVPDPALLRSNDSGIDGLVDRSRGPIEHVAGFREG